MKATLVIAATLWMAACATPPPAAGTSRDEVLRQWGTPTARYAMPSGERLEYATGPYGRTTWMIDLDGGGRVTQARQVLSEADFMQVQVRSAGGLRRDELLRLIGRPGEVKSGGYQGGQVWSWRYPTNDCLWFQVSIADNGVVGSGAFAIDPGCDGPNDRD